MKLVESTPRKKKEYNLFYRSSKVFMVEGEWFFEDEKGEPFGPFESKDQTMQAVRIYRDVKLRGVQYPLNKIKEVL
ncbi:MAG: DUF6316 family protein [Kangiellaceae bacterium]|jgi:hypothetical protein|nr:DUF6316 family protein [Kangiellaceae bacterium]